MFLFLCPESYPDDKYINRCILRSHPVKFLSKKIHTLILVIIHRFMNIHILLYINQRNKSQINYKCIHLYMFIANLEFIYLIHKISFGTIVYSYQVMENILIWFEKINLQHNLSCIIIIIKMCSSSIIVAVTDRIIYHEFRMKSQHYKVNVLSIRMKLYSCHLGPLCHQWPRLLRF